MREEIRLTKGPLLDEKGALIESGYHEDLIRTYDKNDIGVKGLRLKEWDYYYIGNDKHGVALTVADNSYMWLASISVLDFEKKIYHTVSKTGLPFKKLGLPNSSRIGDLTFKRKGFSFGFIHENGERRLMVEMDKFMGKKFSLDVSLTEHPNTSVVIATPFDKPKHFYYNHKINLMTVKGSFTIGQSLYPLSDAFSTLDWGRGVWTYKNTWYWASASGYIENKTIGFNLGYGFGNTSSASENMFYYDGKNYKFSDVEFVIPTKNGKEDYMSLWIFKSKEADIYLEFMPILDRNSSTNALIIKSIQHQVFGKFNGYFKLESGEKVEVKNVMGFAEKVINHW
ncbi:MAG: DUF2804 domain-containing protein [Acholeplasma sp.]|nr:DUF2804 domain-containing protein [Acholeplasma sp.]